MSATMRRVVVLAALAALGVTLAPARGAVPRDALRLADGAEHWRARAPLDPDGA